MNVLIEKKLKKVFKGKRNISRNYLPLRRWKFQDLKILINPLTTAMHLVKARSLGSNEDYLDNIKHSRKKLKTYSEKFSTLDKYVNSNFNYESLRSRLTNHNNKKLSKNKIMNKINQTDLVPITFGVLITKERNSETVSTKQNSGRWRNTYVKILMDSGASASIIHEFYVNKNNFITGKTSANEWSTLAGSFSMSHKAEITLKMPELNVTAHISAPFHVTTKKSNYNVIFGRDLLRELEIQLDFHKNFIGWKDINLPMKTIGCKTKTYFTIQDSKNVRNKNKRIKKILDANNKKASLREIVNNLKYLSKLILKFLRKH